MVHKKYITRGGKTYGPYYYESYREDGRVKKKYIGMDSGSNLSSIKNMFLSNNKSFTLQVLVVVFLVMAIASVGYYTMSGHSISDVSATNDVTSDVVSSPESSDTSTSTETSSPVSSQEITPENPSTSSDNSNSDSSSQSSTSEQTSETTSQEIPQDTIPIINVQQNESTDPIVEQQENETTILPINNETIDTNTTESNETISNETIVEQPINETVVNDTIIPVVNETVPALISIKDIPTLRIAKNSNLDIDLSQYFSGAESYSAEIQDIETTFNGNIVTFVPLTDFSGSRQATIISYAGNESLQSNAFTILVSSGAISIQTIREQIKVGEPVRWTKNVSMDEAQTVSVQLPSEAEDIVITQIQEEVVAPVDTVLTGNSILAQDKQDSWFTSLFSNIFNFLTFNTLTGNVISEAENISAPIDVTLDNNSTQYTIEYTTPGPEAVETQNARGKQISITTSGQLNYTDVIASTNLSNSFKINSAQTIKIKWHNYDLEAVAAAEANDLALLAQIQNELKEVSEVPENTVTEEIVVEGNESTITPITNNTSTEEINNFSQENVSVFGITGNVVSDEEKENLTVSLGQTISGITPSVYTDANGSKYIIQDVAFDAYDLDEDGSIDYIEWVVPHFSEQIYDIIVITKAEHLDQDRLLIEDIYDQVKTLDNITTTIPAGDYVRVTFEINLTNSRDITIYANASENVTVRVYEKDSNTELAVFENISGFERRQILLTALSNGTQQDTFDLLVQGNEVEFDYIVDPQINPLSETGLVALYHLDNNSIYGESGTYIYDFTGNGNNGTSVNGAVANSSGRFAGGYRFDGVNDYINLGNTLNLTGNISVSAWIYLDDNSTSSGKVVACRGLWNTGDSYGQWCLSLASGRPGLYVSNGTSSLQPTNTYLNRSQWYYLVGTFNGTASIMYINGILEGTANDANFGGRLNSAPDPYNVFAIGDRAADAAYYFNGTIDEVAIYNRTLNASEVLRLYQQQIGRAIVWNCTTGTNNFSFAGCWNLGRVPIGNDEVVFNATGVGNVNITNNVMPQNLNSFTVASGYTGTIHFNSKFAQGIWKEPIEKGIFYNDLTPVPNLIYRFNNDATYGEDSSKVYDFSGNGNHGTVSGGAISNSSGGILGTGGYTFDGVNGYILNNSLSSFVNNFTTSLWFKNSKADVTANGHLIYVVNSSNSALFSIRVLTNEKLYFEVYNNSGQTPTLEKGDVPDTNWHHVVLSAKDLGSNVINATMYLDGNLILNSTINGSLAIGNSIKIFVGSTQTPNGYFNGSMDELVFFNRSLSAAEINSLYLRGLPGTQEWNVTENISINGGTMKIYGDAPANIRGEGNGQIWNSVSGNIIINNSGKIDGRGLGFPGQTGLYGGCVGSALCGASHAGRAIDNSENILGSIYGNLTAPTSLGGGGGDLGLSGGSAIKLDASSGIVLINGDINMSGTGASNYNGAGGSIWIRALNITGNGSLKVDGGNVGAGRGGAGGYIRLEYITTMNYTGFLSTAGGILPGFGETGRFTFTNNTWPGDWNVRGNIGLAGGDYGDGNVTYVLGNFVLNGYNITAYGDCYNITSNGARTCYNISSEGAGVWINVSGNISMGASANIFGQSPVTGAFSYGFIGGYGPGAPTASASTGSYGGLGGGATPGAIYGSAESPTALGSGGSTGYGTGGSAIRLSSTSNVNINGTISMTGGKLNDAYSGSGGAIFIEGGNITGAGTLNVTGGLAIQAGGGGRIALIATNIINFTGNISADGGLRTINGSGGSFYASAGNIIAINGKITSIGTNGGLINITDTKLNLYGNYNTSRIVASGTSGKVTINYTDCINTSINGFYSNITDWSSCGFTYVGLCGNLTVANTRNILVTNVSSAGTCFNVSANNVSLDGKGYFVNYSQSLAGNAVRVEKVNYTTVKNLNIFEGSSSASHAISTEVGASAPSNNLTITNNSINQNLGNGNTGIYLLTSSSLIENNRVNDSTGSGGSPIVLAGTSFPNIEPNFNNITGNILRGVNYGARGVYILGYYLAIGNSITNNNITIENGQLSRGIELGNANYSNVINNIINISSGDSVTYGVLISVVGGSLISNNTVTVSTINPAVYVTSSTNLTFSGNRFNSSRSLGIEFSGTTAKHFNHTMDSTNLAEGLPISFASEKSNISAGGAQEIGTLDDYLTNNLVALYHLNNESRYGENSTRVYDFTGNGNNGTIAGGAIANTSGQLRGAYTFDGVNDNIDLGQPTMFNMTSTNNFAFSVWVKPYDITVGQQIIFSRGSSQSGPDQTAYALGTFTVGGSRLVYEVSDGASRIWSLTNTGTLVANSWQMLTVNYDGNTKNLSIYKNGTILDSVKNSTFGTVWDGGANANVRKTGIGFDAKSGNSFFNGSIDEFAIWNRSLSASEILALYNKQVGNFQNVYGHIMCVGCNNVTYDSINMSNDGITLINTSNSRITNSKVNTSNGYGLYLYGNGRNNVLENNTIVTNSAYARGIYVVSSNYINITNNLINTTGATSSGLELTYSSNDIIIGNSINLTGPGGSGSAGISMAGGGSSGVTSNNTISNNIVRTAGSNSYNLYLQGVGVSFNYIANNNFTGVNSGDSNPVGINLYTGPANNSFFNNTVTTSAGVSFIIGGSGGAASSNNTLINNKIYSKSAGACAFKVGNQEHNVTLQDNIINSSTSGLEFCIASSDLTPGNGLWNLTNVTRADGTPINVSWASGANGTLSVRWYLTPAVSVNQTGAALSGANVSAWNTNNVLQFSELSGVNGNISQRAVLEYLQTNNSAGGTTKTYYAPYSLNSTRSGYVDFRNTTINMTLNMLVNVTMHQTTSGVSFVSPTPANGTQQSANSIPVNVSADSIYDHYVLTDFDNSLVLWQRMETLNSTGNGIVDSSPSSINGTIVAGAVQNASGRFGKSISFDGTTGYVNLGNQQALNFNNNSNFTVSAWVNLRNGTSPGGYPIFTKLNGQGYRLVAYPSGLLIFSFRNASGSDGTQIYNISAPRIPNSSWAHVAFTFTQGNVSLYTDGVRTMNALTNIALSNGSDEAAIGKDLNVNTFFNGSIDEVIVLNRTLSPAEIASLYNASANKYYNNFTNLARRSPLYGITSHVVDLAGNLNSTDGRYISIPATTGLEAYTLADRKGWFSQSQNVTAVRNMTWIFANYTVTSDNSNLGPGALCNVTFTGGTETNTPINMTFNATAQLYYYNRTFNYAGNYSYNVSCSLVTYIPASVIGGLNVSIPLRNYSVQGYTTNLGTVNYNENVNLTLLVPNYGIDNSTTGYNLSTVWANVTKPDGTVTRVFLSGNVAGGVWNGTYVASGILGNYSVRYYANLTNRYQIAENVSNNFTVKNTSITIIVQSIANTTQTIPISGQIRLTNGSGTENLANNLFVISLNGVTVSSDTSSDSNFTAGTGTGVNASNVLQLNLSGKSEIMRYNDNFSSAAYATDSIAYNSAGYDSNLQRIFSLDYMTSTKGNITYLFNSSTMFYNASVRIVTATGLFDGGGNTSVYYSYNATTWNILNSSIVQGANITASVPVNGKTAFYLMLRSDTNNFNNQNPIVSYEVNTTQYQYSAVGEYVSKVINLPNVTYTVLKWDQNVSAGSAVLQMRESDDGSTWGAWSSNYTNNLVNSITEFSKSYVQYNVSLTTSNLNMTPTIYRVNISYFNASTNSSGGYNYNITIPTDSLGALPLRVSVLQSAQGIVGYNTTNVTVWAETSTPYYIVRNYSNSNANYSVYVNFTRTDTGALVNGTINVSIRHSSGAISTKQFYGSQAIASWLSPEDVQYGNYTINITAHNVSAYYLNTTTNFTDFLEFRNTTGTLSALNRTITDMTAGTDYPFYWNISITNTGNASMLNSIVYNATKPSIIRNFSIANTCTRIYPNQTCNVTALITVAGGAQAGAYQIPWRANWSDNDGSVAGGNPYISFTEMYISITLNASISVSNSSINRTVQHGRNDTFNFTVSSSGTDTLAGISTVFIELNRTSEYVLNSSWINISPSTIVSIAAGSSRNVTVNISIPLQTAPGNYSGVLNITSNGGDREIDLKVIVPVNGSWLLVPETNFSYNRSFSLNLAGEIGNFTLVNLGNINMTFNLSYSPTSDAATDYSLYGTNLFAPNYVVSGTVSNPTVFNVTKGENSTITLWHKGNLEPLQDVGVTMTIFNSSASPTRLQIKDAFIISEQPPVALGGLFSFDNFLTNTSVGEQNRNITIKFRATDDVSLDPVRTVFNITWATGSALVNATIIESEITYDGLDVIDANYSVSYAPSTTGTYQVFSKVYDLAGFSDTSETYSFTVLGSTTVALSQNISSINIANVDLTHQAVFYVNYTVNNSGTVYAYSPTLTFSGNSAILVNGQVLSDLAGGSISSTSIRMNVSAMTATGQYNITATLSWRNPNNIVSTDSKIISINVLQNKSIVLYPSTVAYGNMVHGNTNYSTILINNTGNTALGNTVLSCYVGSLCNNFSIGYSDSGFAISTNSSSTINISLTAPVGLAPGSYNGFINVSENNISTTFEVQATIVSSPSWNVSATYASGTVQSSSAGRLSDLIINNTGNTALSFLLSALNYSEIQPNVSSITVSALSTERFAINYTSPASEGVYPNIIFINESTLVSSPPRINVSVNMSVTKLTATFISPTSAMPLTDVLAGDTISIVANLTYVGSIVSTNTSWNVSVESTDCLDVNSVYSGISQLWTITCTAPDVSDGAYYDISITANHDSYGTFIATEDSSIQYLDITPPEFTITRNSVNKNINISLVADLSDNVGISNVSAVITYPNSTTVAVNLTNTSSTRFVFSSIVLTLPGEYTVNYTSDDTSGNSNSTVDWFEVYDKYGWSSKILDSDSVAVSGVNLTLLRPNTTTLLLSNSTPVSGMFSLNVNRRFYDLQSTISGDSVLVKNVNLSNVSTSNITLNLHKYNGELLSEIVPLFKPFTGIVNNATGFNANEVQAMFNYSGYSYDTSSQLKIVKCSVWNYTSKVCAGSWSALPSSTNLNSKMVTGNATGFTRSAFFLAENKCGNGACEATYSEDSGSCSLDCQSSAATTTTSSGGGGGGSGSLSEKDLNKIAEIIRGSVNLNGVRIDTTSIYREVFSGDTTTVTIKVTNTLGATSDMVLTTDGEVSGFLTYENNNIELGPGESRDVLVRIAVPKFTKPGDYVGNIIITNGGKSGTIPATIKVLSPEGKLLDVKIQPLQSKIAPGEVLRLQLDLLNLGQTKRVDIQFELQLLDINTGRVITRQEEAFAVETTTSVIKNMTIPKDTPIGHYLVKGVAYYASLEASNQTATSITEIVVDYPLWNKRLLFVPVWLWFTLFGAVGIIVGGVYYRRYNEFKNKRFKSKVDLSKLVQPGPNAAFIGKVAETGIRAFTDLNKLQMHTLVAGSTGGGKTVAAQAIVEAALLHNKSVIVFDPTAQWTGFFRKCEDKNMLNRYSFFDMKTGEARSFNGSIRTIHDPYEIINMSKYMSRPGEITVLDVSNLTPAQIDILAASSIEQIFNSRPEESSDLKTLIVYDEVHRLLPKFGGTGTGFIQIERACREFRKWGIGLVLISQVLSDFVGEIKANIGTEIQLGTRYEGDLERVNVKYGEDVLKSVVKEPIGTGMIVNAEYNSGRPYFVAFRPLLHGTKRLSKVDLEKYEKYFNQVEDLEFQIDELKKLEADVFDVALELKLARDKVKEGQFQIADMYIESLLPNVEAAWKKVGKKPLHMERKTLAKTQLSEALDKAAKERANYLKKNPQAELSFDEKILEINRKLKEKQVKKDTSKLESRVKELILKVKTAGDKLSDKEKDEVKKELDNIKKEATEL